MVFPFAENYHEEAVAHFGFGIIWTDPVCMSHVASGSSRNFPQRRSKLIQRHLVQTHIR